MNRDSRGLDQSLEPNAASQSGIFVFGTRKIDSRLIAGGALAICLGLAVLCGMSFEKMERPTEQANSGRQAVPGLEVAAIPAPAPLLLEAPPKAAIRERLQEHVTILKRLQLWDVKPGATVPSVTFGSFPVNMNLVEDVSLKKKIFFNTLLPAALVANKEVEQEREFLLSILGKLEGMPRFLESTETTSVLSSDSWQEDLTPAEIEFLSYLTDKYRTMDTERLLRRVQPVPVSLMLAQAALESSWGGSRFARLGNNIFGMYTWGDEGIVPAGREDGKSHRLRVYDSLVDSMRSYVLTLNRLQAYEQLRTLREQTRNPLTLAEGLEFYSERGQEYIADVQQMISYNSLQRYDNLQLGDRLASSESMLP